MLKLMKSDQHASSFNKMLTKLRLESCPRNVARRTLSSRALTDVRSVLTLHSRSRVIDIGSVDAYMRAHIPGATRLPIDPFLKDPHSNTPISSELFGEMCTVLGIQRDTHVVAYDGGSIMWASRLWWLLRYFGHEKVSVLDGCWPAYAAAELPISVRPVSYELEGSDYAQEQAQAKRELLATAGEVLDVVNSGSVTSRPVQLLDTRSMAEWTGQELKGNARGGRIPGAKHVPHTDMLRRDGTFKPADELRSTFERAGLDLSLPTFSYCQLGIRGAMGVLAWEIATGGKGRAANYDGSMKEWANNPAYPMEK